MTPEQHITDIAAVLAAHERYYVHGDDHDRCSGCRWVGDSDEHRAHAAAEIVKAEAAARRIDTVEQLNALPDGTIISDAPDRALVAKVDSIGERVWAMGSQWTRIVMLPATLLWTPTSPS